MVELQEAKKVADEFQAEINALAKRNTSTERVVRHKYSQKLKKASPVFVIEVARILLKEYDQRAWAYELIAHHQAAFKSIGEAELEEFGAAINSWWTVDSFARTLSGPAWRYGLVSDELIHRWAASDNFW